MINHCSVYRKDTGEIVQYSNFYCADDAEYIANNCLVKVMAFGSDDHSFVKEQSNRDTQYVQVIDGVAEVIDKPELVVAIDKTEILADGEDFATLTDLPDPCEIIVDDPDPTVETTTTQVFGGGFEFAAETPGVYTLEVRRFPFLPWLVEITAS